MPARSLGRRGLIAWLGAAAACPLAARAQQPERLRRLGVLTAYRENDPSTQPFVTAFVQALERFGWAEGKNIQIDYRFAAGDPALFRSYAADLVELSPDAILASSSLPVAALRQQTRTIPIVFAAVGDPVGQGFVQSLARPGGNITGLSSPDALLYGKWLQLLKEIAPRVTRVAVIFNPDATPAAVMFNASIDAIEAAAPSLGISVTLAPFRDDSGIEAAIAAQSREPGGGLIDYPDGGFTTTHRDVIIAAAVRQRLPMIGWHAVSRAGGLMSYWFDPVDSFAGAASYIDRILKGAKPADLPVQQPTKYSLINLKTARALGLTVPQSILQRADEVIE
jgi:putative tryptophan/tyrosine transport system substrate-binding protein